VISIGSYSRGGVVVGYGEAVGVGVRQMRACMRAAVDSELGTPAAMAYSNIVSASTHRPASKYARPSARKRSAIGRSE
jgi:hypothetical protein